MHDNPELETETETETAKILHFGALAYTAVMLVALSSQRGSFVK
jgi:hypothetical protein